MATISSTGVGSGLDVNSIVTQLISAEKQPLTLLSSQQTSYKADLSAFGQLQSILAGVQNAAKGLTDATANPAYLATSGNGSVLTATASSTAVPGSYAISVTQLAQAQKLATAGVADATAAIGSGASTTLTLDFGTISGGSFNSGSGTYSGASFSANGARTPVNITIGSSNNTLAGIRDAINAAGAGVTATIVNDGSATPNRLVLTSTETGAANSIRISSSGDAAIGSLLAHDPTGTQNLTQLQNAQNSQFTVDGIAITKASNTVSDALQGVTLNLAGLSATPTTLTVQQDSGKLGTAINTLITAYNNAEQLLDKLTIVNGPLQGDPTTLTIQRQLRTLIGDSVSTTGIYKSLASIHVTLQKDGSLSTDATKMQAAITANYKDVASLVNGFGTSLTTLTKNILDPNVGQIANATTGLNAAIKANTKKQDEFNLRLDSLEARYRAQFTALDTMMSSMNQTSSFLQQQFFKSTSSS
jgi:flagellar hook-associated protein 2